MPVRTRVHQSEKSIIGANVPEWGRGGVSKRGGNCKKVIPKGRGMPKGGGDSKVIGMLGFFQLYPIVGLHFSSTEYNKVRVK